MIRPTTALKFSLTRASLQTPVIGSQTSVPNRLVSYYGKSVDASPNGNWATRSDWLGRDNDAPTKLEREWEYDYFFATSEFAKKYKLDDNFANWANNNTMHWRDYLKKNMAYESSRWLRWWTIVFTFLYWRWYCRKMQCDLAPKGLEGLNDNAYFPLNHTILFQGGAYIGHAGNHYGQMWN